MNIDTAAPGSLRWNSGDVAASLQGLLTYVEKQTQESMQWYWRNKRWKSLLSQWIQLLTVILLSSAAIAPIVGQLAHVSILSQPLLATFLVGLAGALVALDKYFGFSSGWKRYVIAATSIRKALEEFRMDWVAMIMRAGASPNPDQIEELIARARQFRLAVEGMVLQETKDWVTEFEGNLARLEKDAIAAGRKR